MGASSKNHDADRYKLAAQNRKARHDYFIVETMEAGLVLTGPEVKSLRMGRAQIVESYASDKNGEMWLYNSYIPEYSYGVKDKPQFPRRPRKLLMHKREINKLIGAITREGMTAVPLDIHFTSQGRAKLTLGLAKGKAKADKREAVKKREWEREKGRLLKEHNR